MPEPNSVDDDVTLQPVPVWGKLMNDDGVPFGDILAIAEISPLKGDIDTPIKRFPAES